MYVGDGSNDYCAARQLGRRDLVCARRGYALAERLAREPVEAEVAESQPWSVAEGAVARGFVKIDNPRATVLVLVLG